ncbi:unnamed protein product, partial [Urochloa humidicola]
NPLRLSAAVSRLQHCPAADRLLFSRRPPTPISTRRKQRQCRGGAPRRRPIEDRDAVSGGDTATASAFAPSLGPSTTKRRGACRPAAAIRPCAARARPLGPRSGACQSESPDIVPSKGQRRLRPALRPWFPRREAARLPAVAAAAVARLPQHLSSISSTSVGPNRDSRGKSVCWICWSMEINRVGDAAVALQHGATWMQRPGNGTLERSPAGNDDLRNAAEQEWVRPAPIQRLMKSSAVTMVEK